MPPFSNSLPRRWSPSELPILPFLAPRVFQPWPSKNAKVHQKTKTNRNDDKRSLLKFGGSEDNHSRCLGDSSPNGSVHPGRKYARFSQRQSTFTSFAPGSIRHFSSRSGLRVIAGNDERDGYVLEGNSKAPQGFEFNPQMKAQSGTAASTHQDLGMDGSANTSSPPKPRRVPGESRKMHGISLPEVRHLRIRSIAHHVPVVVEDVSQPRNIEAGRLEDSIAFSVHDNPRPTTQQPSSSTPLPRSQVEGLEKLSSSPPFPSTSTPAQKFRNTSDSSCQPTAAPRETDTKTSNLKYRKNESERPGQSILQSLCRNEPLEDPGLIRRPKGLMFRAEDFRQHKGLYLGNRNMSLDTHRLKGKDFAPVEGPFQALRDQYELWAKQQGLPELPTKYLKINPEKEANMMKIQLWSSQFAIVNQRHEDALKAYPKLEYKRVAVSNFPMATRLLFIKQDNVAALATIWRRVPAETRSRIWEELMLTSMDKYPASTLKLLLATYQHPPLPPQWAANDCLDFVVAHYFGSEERKPTIDSFTTGDLRHIFESIRYLQLRGFRLSARSIYLLQLMMDDKEFKTFYLVLAGTRQHLTGKTLLRFAYRFARSRETDLAFQVLQQATRQGINLNLERWPQICNVILARRYRDPSARVNDTELFEFMLHHGLRPAICTYNILIQNSLQAGDHITAWQIYDMMIDNGVMADVYTYSIMLNDAKIRRDDIAVERLAHWMNVDGVRNSYTATDILDSMFLFHRREYFRRPPSERKSLPTPFSQMLPIYMKNFNVKPLAQVIFGFEENFLSPGLKSSAGQVDGISFANTYQAPVHVDLDQNHPDLPVMAMPGITSNKEPDSAQFLMEPNPVTLIVMLKSYIGSVRNYEALLRFYDHFKFLISTRNPIVAPLLQQAQIYNHLLVGLGHLDAPMHDCLKIIADMQTPHSKQRQLVPTIKNDQSRDESNTVEVANISDETYSGFLSDDVPFNSTEDRFQPPAPSLHTWTTLLNVFMQRHQPRAAEKVLQIMIEKEGLDPNQATWNALTMGYMRLQDPLMVADALLRTKRSGFIVDHIMSSRWWLRFQARARLSEALQATSDGNETSLTDVANAIESETDVVDPVEDEIIDEEVLEATTSKTGDIYRIIKRRLHAVNSPVYPNWIFDAMLRVHEEDIIKQEPQPVLGNIFESELESTKSPEKSNSAIEQEAKLFHHDVAESRTESPQSSEKPDIATEQGSDQFSGSQDTGASSQADGHIDEQRRPSETEDEKESRLLPANRLIVRRATQMKMSFRGRAFRCRVLEKLL